MAQKIPGMSFPKIESRQVSLLASDAEIQRLTKQWAEEDNSNLLLLCQHYRIQAGPFMFYNLSLALARELYPEPKKRGAKPKWMILNRGALVVEIERLVQPDNQTYRVVLAARKLAEREPWKSFLKIKEPGKTCSDPAEALRHAYYSFKGSRWAELMRDYFRMHEHEGRIAAWEELVTDYVKNPHLRIIHRNLL